jgi:hypothetical protein
VTRQTVSACLIVRNEEARLAHALESVAFCDEVIVVDSGSTDATVALARASGATVVEHAWRGFAVQRNVALDRASGDWILEIDADERVTAALREEIVGFLADPGDADLCALPLRERFLGAWLGPAAKYPNYRLRLFRRGAYRHDERRVVHEGLVSEGPVRPLEGELEHLLADGWSEALRDMWLYARLDAAQAPALAGAVAYARGLVARPAAKFAYRLVVDGGWRDGPAGVIRIGLDCASDAIVVGRRLLGRAPAPPAGVPAGTDHFGRDDRRVGPVRLVAVAGGEQDSRRALAWLEAARAAGADVALISAAPPAGAHAVRVRRMPRLGVLHLTRAVDAENQLRTIDLLVTAPGRAARLARLVPGVLRGGVPPAGLDTDPLAAITAAR